MQKKTRKMVALVLAGALMSGIFAACAKDSGVKEGSAVSRSMENDGDTASAEKRSTLVIATESEPPTLHPFDHKAVTATYMNLLTFNALMAIDPQTLEPVTDLAESYEAVSDTEWVFTLKQGVTFHDGSTLDAQDVKASMEYAKTYPTTKDYTSFWTDIQVVDDTHVKITTDGPYAMVLNDMASIDILPSELIDEGTDFSENPVGTGPYCFVEWNRGDNITFEKNPNFFDTEHQPSIETITWRIIPEGSSRTIALQAGEVDFIMEVEATDITRLKEDEAVTVQENEGTRMNFMAMNSEAGPFENPWFRKAVSAAVDRDAVITVSCDGQGIVALGQTSPAFPGYSEENSQDYDVKKAKEYLEKSGIDPEDATFTCLACTDANRRAAEVIQANLMEIGIQMEIETLDYATHLNAIMSGDYEAAIQGYTASNMYAYNVGLYHSSAIDAANLARIDDQKVDSLIEKAKTQLDSVQREATFTELSEYLNDWTPFVPLYQTVVIKAYDKDLEGVVVGKDGNVAFEDVRWSE